MPHSPQDRFLESYIYDEDQRGFYDSDDKAIEETKDDLDSLGSNRLQLTIFEDGFDEDSELGTFSSEALHVESVLDSELEESSADILEDSLARERESFLDKYFSDIRCTITFLFKESRDQISRILSRANNISYGPDEQMRVIARRLMSSTENVFNDYISTKSNLMSIGKRLEVIVQELTQDFSSAVDDVIAIQYDFERLYDAGLELVGEGNEDRLVQAVDKLKERFNPHVVKEIVFRDIVVELLERMEMEEELNDSVFDSLLDIFSLPVLLLDEALVAAERRTLVLVNVRMIRNLMKTIQLDKKQDALLIRAKNNLRSTFLQLNALDFSDAVSSYILELQDRQVQEERLQVQQEHLLVIQDKEREYFSKGGNMPISLLLKRIQPLWDSRNYTVNKPDFDNFIEVLLNMYSTILKISGGEHAGRTTPFVFSGGDLEQELRIFVKQHSEIWVCADVRVLNFKEGYLLLDALSAVATYSGIPKECVKEYFEEHMPELMPVVNRLIAKATDGVELYRELFRRYSPY
jgi:hypothetical protein